MFTTPSASAAIATPPHVSLTPEQIASRAGLYYDPLSESAGRIFVRDGKLLVRGDAGEGEGLELIPIRADQFFVSGTTIALESFRLRLHNLRGSPDRRWTEAHRAAKGADFVRTVEHGTARISRRVH